MVNGRNDSIDHRHNSWFIYCSNNECFRLSKCCEHSNNRYCGCITNSSDNYSRWFDYFLHRRICYFNFQCRKFLPVVKRGNNAIHYCYNCRNLYCSDHQSFRMSKCCECANNCNSKCPTNSANNYCRRGNDFLYRRIRYFDFQRREFLLVVKRSNDSIDHCHNSWFLYCPGDKCLKLSESGKHSDNNYGKCFTNNSNNLSRRRNDFLFRRIRYFDFQCRNILFMVDRRNIAIH